jgi:hypothetical protein
MVEFLHAIAIIGQQLKSYDPARKGKHPLHPSSRSQYNQPITSLRQTHFMQPYPSSIANYQRQIDSYDRCGLELE